ncbi:coiled-coil domain-containing protein [Bdellovibrio reynosensis]|uniref:Uncharacterized protein n=1 Tax=Bdellovibrio reynosensis TaxID=2835041 RepID=A0ABY4C6E5_9BACT|nr:hypothetical protein [Bdellovibrio reynosensis]UOF00547.1 hypothetical protein MNR06_12645 [Bdellovibrio reynosensis]
MNKISGKKNQSVVKIFINSAMAVIFCSYTLPAFGEESSDRRDRPGMSDADRKYWEDKDKKDREEREKRDLAATCKSHGEKLAEATKEIGNLCSKSGYSSQESCTTKAIECGEEASSGTEFNPFDTVGTILGLPPGSVDSGKQCPQLNGRDYYTEKKDIERDIAETEKELADLNDEKAKAEKEYKKEMNELQEALSKAQEDYKKHSLEIDEKERERVAEFHASQNQAKDEMRKKGSEILRLQGEMTKTQQTKAKELLLISESKAQRDCAKAVATERANQQAAQATSRSNYMRQATTNKKNLVSVWENCLKTFDEARKELMSSTRQAQMELQKQMADSRDDVDEIQNSLNLASSQLDEMKQASLKEKSDAVQAVIDLGTRTQTQMQSAYQNLLETQKTLAAKGQSLQNKLNRLNQSLAAMGPAPKRGTEHAISDIGPRLDAQINIIDNLKTISECPQVQKDAKAASDKLGSGVR